MRRRYKKISLGELLNRSTNTTLSRTILTSFTTLLALFALFFFGGGVIRGFTAGLLWGVTIGTYSSICLAVPDRQSVVLGKRVAGRVDIGGRRNIKKKER